jgi:vanillate O-demethylase monooxygenase subunit
MAIARNQWYVAAYSEEVGQDLLGRTICGEPLVFYRTEAGKAVALADRCVHRRYPLSESNRVGDRIVCGYHGFTYDSGGSCVAVPGQSRVPRTARVPAYQVVEQDSLVWVWIGDGETNGDESAVPRAPWLDSPGYTVIRGMAPLKARYELLVDNLMDLSHETYLHAGYIGTPEVAETPITTEVDADAGVVYVSRRMTDVECPPFYARSTGIEGRIDRWQDIEYFPPCLYVLHSRIAPTGLEADADGDDGDDRGAAHAKIVYAITPETERTTFDFWMVARDFATEDAEVSTYLYKSNSTVVDQDVVALDLLERVIAAEPEGYRELSINIDTGALAARRLLNRLSS